MPTQIVGHSPELVELRVQVGHALRKRGDRRQYLLLHVFEAEQRPWYGDYVIGCARGWNVAAVGHVILLLVTRFAGSRFSHGRAMSRRAAVRRD